MKHRISILFVLAVITTGIQARIFEAGERLYFNMEAQSVKDAGGNLQYGWYATTNNYNYAYFFNSTSNGWSSKAKQYSGTIWYVEAPAGNWDHVILTRHNSATASWSTKTDQTGDISFYYTEGGQTKMREQNYIQNFYYNDGGTRNGANWAFIAPAPTGNPASWTYEDEQICKSAAGSTYMLQAKNYNYDDTYAHAWFKYENNTWTRLQGEELRDTEGDKAFEVNLGSENSDIYYFLQASRPSMCRLIRIRINQNCSDGAPGACKITSFVAVASDANVTDQTTAINGVVAFDDRKNAGQLQIWSPGVDTLIIDNNDIETPQTFRLKGFDASAAKTYTLYATFLSGDGCDASCTVSVTPPTVSPTTHTTTGTDSDLRLTRFTQEDVTLTPTNQNSTYFQWTNSADEVVISGTYPENRNLTFTAPTEAKDIDYYLMATNDPPSPEGNLISNGTFETEDNLESKYNYWGKDLTNYYDTHPGASGGYAIVQNSSDFYHTYNTVVAHEGSYFGLFDSKVTSNVEDQAAWIAKSGSKNPKLKVQAGVSYLFSFWVANINAFYQMNNGARLQFQISYDGGTTWSDLGGEINLGNYKDNRWHGLSSIATPTTSSTNVALRVINKNTSGMNIGNDFALDDIRFEAVTASTSNIAGYERFPVHYLLCEINNATFAQRQPVGCGTDIADVDYTISFVHPRGDLFIYEGTELLARIPHSEIGDNATSYTGVLSNRPVDNADHTMTVYFDDEHVKTDAPTTYIYNARAIPSITVKSLSWSTVSCDVPTTTLTAVIGYTNQNGSFTANVDGGAPASGTFTAENDEELETTITIPEVPADGLDTHKLNVIFNGSHGCTITDYSILSPAPLTPTIDTANISFSAPSCDNLATSLTFDLDYTYQQGTFTYWVDGMTPQTATYTEADKTTQRLTGLNVEGIPADGQTHTLHVSFDGANSCVKSYSLPAVPLLRSCIKDEATICEGETYPWMGNSYTRPVGIDTITNPANVYDTLILTVLATPRISVGIIAMTCDEANEIRVPFSVTNGTPDSYDIAVDGVHTAGTIDGTDIVFSLAAMTPGDYTATITASEAGLCESTSDISFTIAISNQMYSKWTDVLFIDNHDHSYTGYQWYADGSAIANENQQYLYRPEGMSGQSTLFHCRLTTTDGKTLYTCPMTFDEVPRSADATPASTPAQVIRTYRVGPHVQIVQTIEGEHIQTRKIIIHE